MLMIQWACSVKDGRHMLYSHQCNASSANVSSVSLCPTCTKFLKFDVHDDGCNGDNAGDDGECK